MSARLDRAAHPPGTVLFAEDFDLPPQHGAVPEPEVIEPTFTRTELDAARQQAWQAGHESATAAAAQADNAAIRDTIEAMAATLADARGQAVATVQQTADELARLLLDAFAAMLPTLCARHGEPELRSLIRTLLPALSQEPSVTIRINPCHAPAIVREVERIDPDLAARLDIVAADTIPPGDARIAWRGGQAVRDGAALWARIAEILEPAGLLSYATHKEAEHVE